MLKNGAHYNGEWLNNLQDGHGVQIYKNKARVEGEWKQGKVSGFGRLT